MSEKWIKYLVVIVNRNLTWKDHVSRNVSATWQRSVRASSFLSLKTKKQLYNALVLPHLVLFGRNVGRPWTSNLRDCKTSSPRLTPRTALRNRLGWVTWSQRWQMFMLIQLHRCLHNWALCSKFVTNGSLSYRRARSGNNIHLKKPVTDFYTKSFEFSGSHDWNNLPTDIKILNQKLLIKKHC